MCRCLYMSRKEEQGREIDRKGKINLMRIDSAQQSTDYRNIPGLQV